MLERNFLISPFIIDIFSIHLLTIISAFLRRKESRVGSSNWFEFMERRRKQKNINSSHVQYIKHSGEEGKKMLRQFFFAPHHFSQSSWLAFPKAFILLTLSMPVTFIQIHKHKNYEIFVFVLGHATLFCGS